MTTTEAIADTEATEDAPKGSALVRSVRAIVSKKKTFELRDITSAVIDTRHDAREGDVAKVGGDTPLPKAILALPAELEDAIPGVTEALGNLELPQTHRKLRAPELRTLLDLYKTVGSFADFYKDARESIKVAVNNHINIKLDESGTVTTETEVDSHGNWAVKTHTGDDLPDAAIRFVRSYRRPSVDIDPDELKRLKDEGKLTTTQYNRITRPVRVVDEHGFNSLVAREPELMDVLQEAIVVTSAPQVPLSVGRNTTEPKKG